VVQRDFFVAQKGFLDVHRDFFAVHTYLYRVHGLCEKPCCLFHTGRGIFRQVIYFSRNWGSGILCNNAQVQIGLAYELGSVVAQSYREAFKWFLEAANQGNAQAMRYLADLYREGKGVPIDYNEAAKWLQKARDRLKKAGARAGDYF
jgi:TPR repeat protein